MQVEGFADFLKKAKNAARSIKKGFRKATDIDGIKTAIKNKFTVEYDLGDKEDFNNIMYDTYHLYDYKNGEQAFQKARTNKKLTQVVKTYGGYFQTLFELEPYFKKLGFRFIHNAMITFNAKLENVSEDDELNQKCIIMNLRTGKLDVRKICWYKEEDGKGNIGWVQEGFGGDEDVVGYVENKDSIVIRSGRSQLVRIKNLNNRKIAVVRNKSTNEFIVTSFKNLSNKEVNIKGSPKTTVYLFEHLIQEFDDHFSFPEEKKQINRVLSAFDYKTVDEALKKIAILCKYDGRPDYLGSIDKSDLELLEIFKKRLKSIGKLTNLRNNVCFEMREFHDEKLSEYVYKFEPPKYDVLFVKTSDGKINDVTDDVKFECEDGSLFIKDSEDQVVGWYKKGEIHVINRGREKIFDDSGRSGLTNYVEFEDLPKLEQEMIEKHYLKESVDTSKQFKSFDKFLQEALQLKQ